MIALCDVRLQLTYNYGMANKILEAMTYGLPVITNIAHAFMHYTRCGIVAEYSNVNQIKQAIFSLKKHLSFVKVWEKMIVKHFYKNIIGKIWKKNYIKFMRN